jgi:hypothetical protein
MSTGIERVCEALDLDLPEEELLRGVDRLAGESGRRAPSTNTVQMKGMPL